MLAGFAAVIAMVPGPSAARTTPPPVTPARTVPGAPAPLTITTEGGAPITSRDDYVNGSMLLDGVQRAIEIRGRGNSTWTWPKKPYKIKLAEDAALLGTEPRDEWVLLANYADRTAMRNWLAMSLGASTRLAFTPRTRVLWINSPHNPTGVVFTAAEIVGIAELCQARDLWLLSDEVYEDLAFARPHVSPWSLPGMAERTVVVSSLSKSHAMPGFRFGWIIGPVTLSQHLFNLLLCMIYGSPAFIQDGVLAALETELPDAGALRGAYRARAGLLTGILSEAPNCRVTPPEGGMFVLLDIRNSGLGSEGFARELLRQEYVAVLPCDSFGPSAAGHLRVSLTAPEPRLAEAGRRIVRFAAALGGKRA